ncbi:hypothetical protein PV04_06785 [Phialophora macrospora]|uniref:Uncharacterized protein n=1 Tax=Phialophora macrospora TaxID=1851006 RepID=A0A0D2CQY5_9EURO|nr:hypothetical protein PV04_06785 [Phialophora macrospora]
MGRMECAAGRIYTLRSRSERASSGLLFPDIADMGLVLDGVLDKKDNVKVMTLPISPTKKQHYPIQLRPRNGPSLVYGNTIPITDCRLDPSLFRNGTCIADSYPLQQKLNPGTRGDREGVRRYSTRENLFIRLLSKMNKFSEGKITLNKLFNA